MVPRVDLEAIAAYLNTKFVDEERPLSRSFSKELSLRRPLSRRAAFLFANSPSICDEIESRALVNYAIQPHVPQASPL